MSDTVVIAPGMRVRARYFNPRPLELTALSGMQPKLAAVERIIEGMVEKVRGNHPQNPTSVGVWIKIDSGKQIVVDARHIVAASSEPF